MKKYLENLIASKEARMNDLKAKVEASNDVNEVRSIHAQVEELAREITEARAELGKINDQEQAGVDDQEARGGIPKNAELKGAYKQPTPNESRNADSPYASLEYRQAFADYVRTGKWDFRGSTEGMVVTDDIGKVIPTTIMDEIIKDLKSYGGIYSRVRKLNIKGNVEFAIEEIMPSVRWIDETTPSDEQSAPELKKSIRFGAYTAEVRIASSLLSSVMALSIFEKELSSIIAESFMKEFDSIILNGDGDSKPLGITKDERVPEDHIITMSDSEINDWKQWRKKLFAKIGIKGRRKGCLIMTAGTWESRIMCMEDDNHRPVYSETYNPVSGEDVCRFNSREVLLVENDILKDFDSAENNDVFAVYADLSDYAINSNLMFGMKRYFDEDKNKYVNKGLCIIDGKLLRVQNVFVIKKSADPTKCTITYNGNGKTGGTVPTAQQVNKGSSATISAGTGLKKDTDDIASWNTKADGSGTTYALGGSVTPTADMTLYAIFAAG